ncbi:MAG: glycoside hydrolase family 16 protein [Clostridia bacterium]|nr:glycoside hydrolase family 16 protein [Clostridia bacterium]
MVDFISNTLGLVFREQWALTNAVEGLKSLLTGGGARGLCATFLMIFQMFNMLLTGASVDAWGEELDLTGYELVFEDEFDGETLDMDVWRARGDGGSRGGYSSINQVSVKDGNLIMKGDYQEDGVYGTGWYGASIALREHYCRGYFEIKCKNAASDAFWSAFWIQGLKSPYIAEISKGGIESCEIDIFEAMSYNESNRHNSVTQTIHCAGVGGETEGFQSRNLGNFNGNDIYNEYNTYGLKWTEEEYIFYVNGVETTRSSFGEGVCINPEEIIVSLCVPAAEEFAGRDTSEKCEMIVDYVRIYQLAE